MTRDYKIIRHNMRRGLAGLLSLMAAASTVAQAQACDFIQGSPGDMTAYVWDLYDKDKLDSKMNAQAILFWEKHGPGPMSQHAIIRLKLSECYRSSKDCGELHESEALQKEFRRNGPFNTGTLDRTIVPASPPASMLAWAKQTIGGCAAGQVGPKMSDSVPEIRPLAQCERWYQAIAYNGRTKVSSAYQNFVLRWERDTSTLKRRRICNSADDYVAQAAEREVEWMNTKLDQLDRRRREAEAARQRALQQNAAQLPAAKTEPTFEDRMDAWYRSLPDLAECERRNGKGNCKYERR